MIGGAGASEQPRQETVHVTRGYLTWQPVPPVLGELKAWAGTAEETERQVGGTPRFLHGVWKGGRVHQPMENRACRVGNGPRARVDQRAPQGQ